LENAQRSAEESRAKGLELEAHRQRLESVVEERTRDLAYRLRYSEATALVAHDATAILDPQALLSRVPTLISERLGFYHAAIFLLDETGKRAVLQAASSEGGQQMLRRGYQLPVNAQSIVGQVIRQGKSRLVLDTGVGAVRFDNPDLPHTRSELVLPLRARGEIIGVLDVQSTEEAAFSAETVEALQTLADQLALSINNARLFQQTQENLEMERRAYGELSREAWRELLSARADMGQRYDPQGILPDGGQWREEMKVAAREGKTVLGETLPLSPTGEGKLLATPIKVRDQVIGILDAHKPAGAGEWTTAEIALLETLTEQLGTALESARLYEDARRRATRERLVGEVTARMRETLDLDTVLQTAIREIGEALGIAEVEVRMRSETPRA
ncbi:MAG: GAF domain-containing protein, partial [Chloroflexota bacterium]|nr:GAF domain-containing protein [Chloroflexota bacterium]